MIDIHTHVLPRVDDGPQEWEESLTMLNMAVEDGIRGVVCTSHVMERLDQDIENVLLRRFAELKRRAREAGIDITLWLGSELHSDARLNHQSRVFTINNNRKYVLLELPFGDVPPYADDLFFQLSMKGFKPILAHPERNARLNQNHKMIFDIVNRGTYMQINSGSITGQFGGRIRRLTDDMLARNCVHFVASDAHNASTRPMKMSEAYAHVRDQFGPEMAKRLFYSNPLHAIRGENLETDLPVPFQGKKRRFIFF